MPCGLCVSWVGFPDSETTTYKLLIWSMLVLYNRCFTFFFFPKWLLHQTYNFWIDSDFFQKVSNFYVKLSSDSVSATSLKKRCHSLINLILKNTLFLIRIGCEKEGYKLKSQITNSPPVFGLDTSYLVSNVSRKNLLENPISGTLNT